MCSTNDNQKNNTMRRATVLIGTFLLMIPPILFSEKISPEPYNDTIRFDAIIELNAPQLKTNTLIFARYWVTRHDYVIAMNWAEPQGPGLNFSTPPAGVTIESNKSFFSIESQIHPRLDSVFTKPIGERGIFRHKYNSYPFTDIRFAEPEFDKTQVYCSDFKNLSLDSNKADQLINLLNKPKKEKINTTVAKLDVVFEGDRIRDMNVIDANDRLIKQMHYEYAAQNGQTYLQKMSAFLPERQMTVGFSGKGATIRISNQKHTYKELPGIHHNGGRLCTVDYEPLIVNGQLKSIPNTISVKKLDTKKHLRSAHLSNVVHLRLTQDEIRNAARKFSFYSKDEEQFKELLAKYQQENPTNISQLDQTAIRNFRTSLENTSSKDKTVGEQLKRINLLIQTDWLEASPTLEDHFRQYLSTLNTNGLNQTVLAGGCEILDRTARWGQFDMANQLFDQWCDAVFATQDPVSILEYVRSPVPKTRCWIVASLLDRSLKSQNWDENRLLGETIRCEALAKLSQHNKNDQASNPQIETQIQWAHASLKDKSIVAVLLESLSQAEQNYQELPTPTPLHQSLKKKLDSIKAKTRNNYPTIESSIL